MTLFIFGLTFLVTQMYCTDTPLKYYCNSFFWFLIQKLLPTGIVILQKKADQQAVQSDWEFGS